MPTLLHFILFIDTGVFDLLQKLTFFMNKVPFKGYGQVALTPCFYGQVALTPCFYGQVALIPFLLRAGCPYPFSFFTGRLPLLLLLYYGQDARSPF